MELTFKNTGIILTVIILLQFSCAPHYQRWSDNKEAVENSLKKREIERSQQRNAWLTQCPNEKIAFSDIIGIGDTLLSHLKNHLPEYKNHYNPASGSNHEKKLDSMISQLKDEIQDKKNISERLDSINTKEEYNKMNYYIDSCSLSHFDSSTINKVDEFVSANSNTFSIRSRTEIDGVDTITGNVLFIGYEDHFLNDSFPSIAFYEQFYGKGTFYSGIMWFYVLKKTNDSTYNIIENRFGGYFH